MSAPDPEVRASGRPWRSTPSGSWPLWYALAAMPLALVALLLALPELDVAWESHPAHFWIVLAAAAVCVALGSRVSLAARERRDARLLLVSLAFVVSAGFLGLHALATPGVLLGPNAGFELATPVGLLLGGALVAASSLELSLERSRWLIARWRVLMVGAGALLVTWAAASLARVAPLDDPIEHEQLDGWQGVMAVAGVILYGMAAAGYLRIYRRRRARLLFFMALAFVLLAEAMIVILVARNWHLSWWEWHVMMLCAFGIMALAARSEWHEERFSALYLDETLAGAGNASILFADLQGYTTFSERSSPAEVAEMLSAYFTRLVPLMEDHGGEVHQIIGDALMVVFNKSGDQPDHAELAARAALALQKEAEDLARDAPGWPRFRVGVNSGEVHTGVLGGERGHRKHGLVGDTVNLAARLEAEAPVGEIVIGRGTYEALPSERFVTERLPDLRVKGKAEPVEAYVLRPASGPRDGSPQIPKS